ncbi:MAG: TIGR04255 family protein [Aquabacterium sp.]
MTSPTPVVKPLSVPLVASAHFERNLIRQAVCELRFPTLYELEDARPPIAFAKALRKDYPHHESGNDLNVGVGGLAHPFVHTFRSNRWTVTLRASAIAVETHQYISYAEFRTKVQQVIEAAVKIIDSDFFTRVGLRYINSVPYNQPEMEKWVNPVLMQALSSGIYGDVTEHSQRISGVTESGNYLFQHGIGVRNSRQEYVLDFDFSSENIAVDDCLPTIDKLHEQEFSMFIWALGDNSKAYLGQDKFAKETKGG